MPDFSLKYIIDADGKKARSELDSVETKIAKLGGTISQTSGLSASSLNAIAIGAGAVTSGIIALGAAAVQTGKFLFDLSKEAAEFGSIIYDASQKTGLNAETLSALKYGADQAGSSFEQVTKGIKTFGIEVGKAAANDEQAIATMKDLGVTSTDLDTALKQVFKTIINGRTDVEKLRLANEAFGKKIGPDLIPLIKDAKGNLDELVATAKRLGATINDDAAREADEFGDTLDTLSVQATSLGRQIASPLIPQITKLAKALSDLLVENQTALTNWQKHTSLVFDGVLGYWEDLRKKVAEYNAEVSKSGSFGGFPGGTGFGGPLGLSPGQKQPLISSIDQAVTSRGQQRQLMNSNIVSDTPSIFKFPDPLKEFADAEKAKKAAEDAKQEAEKRARERQDILRRDAAAQVGILNNQLDEVQKVFFTTADKLKDTLKETGDVDSFKATLEQINRVYVAEAGDILLLLDAAEKEVDDIGKKTDAEKELRESNRLKRVRALNDELKKEQERANQAIADSAKKTSEAAIKAREEEQKLREIRNKSWSEYIKNIEDAADAQQAADDEHARQMALAKIASTDHRVTAPGTLGGGIAGGLGVDLISIFDPNNLGVIKTGAQMIKDVYADMADFAGQAIGGMIDGLIQMGVAWISTGEFSAQAALQMLASTAFSIASQAGLKAIFEYAEGLAALAVTWGVPNPSSIAHFAAAGTYASIAVGAGLAGVGLAVGARFAGGGSAGGSRGPQDQPGARDQQEDLSPLSRSSGRSYDSGSRPFEATMAEIGRHLVEMRNMTNQTLNKLDGTLGKFNPMRPGDVLVRGAEQRPGFIGGQATRDMTANPTQAHRFRKNVTG